MTSLRTENVTKAFGGHVALEDVSLDIPAGRITALIGPNGAGKTTLFNTISGFERIDSGRIFLGQKRLDRLPAWQVARSGIGRTFQTPKGFPTLTVLDNLLVSSGDEHERATWAEEILARLGLASFADERLETLSAGDAKLVELGRQLFNRPQALLLDEPAAGVDPSRVPDLAESVRAIQGPDVLTVIIDHNLDFVFGVAEYVHVLAAGRVIFSGTPREAARDEQVTATYLGKPRG